MLVLDGHSRITLYDYWDEAETVYEEGKRRIKDGPGNLCEMQFARSIRASLTVRVAARGSEQTTMLI